MIRKQQNFLRAFTLIELMIVIAVLAILAGVTVMGYGKWRESVAQKEVQTDLQTVATAMLSARNFSNSYPTTVPTNFKPSPNVQLTYVTGNAATYCIEAVSKTNSNIKYYLSSNSKTPLLGNCAGVVLVDESGSGTTTGPSCNPGDVLNGTTCTHTYAATYQTGGYSCPSGGSLSGTTCTSTYGAYYSSGGGYYGCPSGGSLSGTTCTTTSSYPATYTAGTPYCPPGYGGMTWNGVDAYECYSCTKYSGTSCLAYNGSSTYASYTAGSYSCPSGGTLNGTTCTTSSSYAATYYSNPGYYYCTGSDTLSGTTCTHTYTATQGGGAYTCPSGGTLSGTTCTQTYAAS